jgi:hypothetical protein
LCSLHTLDAAISDDSPMLASGRLPPFPGGPSGPAGFLQRISTFDYVIVSFLSGLRLGAICRIFSSTPLRVAPPRVTFQDQAKGDSFFKGSTAAL